MDANRKKQLDDILQRVIQESGFTGQRFEKKDEKGETFGFSINGILKENPGAMKELEDLGCVVFSPCLLGHYTRDQILRMQGPINFYGHMETKCKHSMIIDPKQVEKSQDVANQIIQFYYSNSRTYDNFKGTYERTNNQPLATPKELFDHTSGQPLGEILSRIGFSTELDKDGNLVVNGKDFSMKVDGKTGQAVNPPLVKVSKFQELYMGAKDTISKGFEKLKNFMKLKNREQGPQQKDTADNIDIDK